MKKTIKYGGLIAGAATAAVATMSGAPVFAATTVGANCNILETDAVSQGLTLDESDYASVAAWKTSQATDATAVAGCYTDKATTAATAMQTIAGQMDDVDFTSAGATETSVKAAKSAAQVVLDAFGGDVTDAAAAAKIKAAEPAKWAVVAAANEGKTDVELLDIIATDAEGADTYDFGTTDIYKAYVQAVLADTFIENADAWLDNTIKATEETEKAAILTKEAAAATAVANALDADEDADKAVADAQEAIEELADSDIKTELQGALNAITDGEITADDEQAVTDAKSDADDLESAKNTLLTAAGNDVDSAKTDSGLDAYGDNDVAVAAANNVIAAYYEEGDNAISEVSEDALIAYLKSTSIWDTAKTASGKTKDAEILDYIKTNKATLGVGDLIDKYAAAEKAQALVDAVKAYNTAKAVYDEAKAAADAGTELVAALNALKAAAIQIEAAEDAIDELTELDPSNAYAAELADALDEAADNKSDDNKGSDDTTYSYTTLSDSETAYMEGNDLVLHFDAPFADFEYLTIDGVIIDSSMYMVEAGSTKITLSSTLLDTLKEGEHTVIAYYAGDKTATAKFTIASATVDTAKTVKTPDTGVYTAETSGATNSLAGLLGAITAATLAGAVVVLRKRAA